MVDPGSSGVFGTLTFSHDLVHHLGGQSDTNINTTRRILLLLESFALGRAAHRPTLTAILDRYLSDDFRFGEPDRRTRVPRFLLNDIVRFWRTLCVDYGMKRWTDSNENKWALRNIKLRMSRKWLFASGLLMMFACDEQSAPPDTTESTRERTTEKLIKLAGMTPTDIIVEQLDSIGLTKQLASLLRLYDEYLEKLDNEELRNRVSKLTPEEARNSKDFRWFKNQGRELQNILIETFFGGNSPDLTKFTKEYGVF
jgi:hypothetical protein